jgi:hypothetical protein
VGVTPGYALQWAQLNSRFTSCTLKKHCPLLDAYASQKQPALMHVLLLAKEPHVPDAAPDKHVLPEREQSLRWLHWLELSVAHAAGVV